MILDLCYKYRCFKLARYVESDSSLPVIPSLLSFSKRGLFSEKPSIPISGLIWPVIASWSSSSTCFFVPTASPLIVGPISEIFYIHSFQQKSDVIKVRDYTILADYVARFEKPTVKVP